MVVAVIAPFTGRLADRYPVGILSGAGLTVLAVGLGLLGLLPAHPGSFDIAWRMLICGLGFGFFNTPNNRAIITSAPRNRTGGASGMQAAGRLFGQTTGAALVALVFGLAPLNGTTLDAGVRVGDRAGRGRRQPAADGRAVAAGPLQRTDIPFARGNPHL